MTRIRRSSILAPSLALLLALLLVAGSSGATSRAQTLEDKQAEADRIQQQLNSLKQQSDVIAQEYNDKLTELDSIRYLISDNTEKLKKAQNDYEQAKKVLGSRIRAIYIEGQIDSVEVLLESTSLDDLLSRYDFLNSIANQDLTVFKEMKDLRREIAVRQRDLEDQETRQRQAVAQTQQTQAELQASLSAQESLLASVNAEVLQLLAQYGTVLGDGSTSTSVTITGPFAFPAAGPHAFSNDWHAPRTGHVHQGCDIMASMGTPAVACVNGTITLVTEGGNAGKYFRLTMDGSSTFFYYMHMKDIVVSVGQKVHAGDLVGHIGDTGNARGGPAHIHFEVHPGGGSAVNPYPLLKQFDR